MDLPTSKERYEIWAVQFKKYGRAWLWAALLEIQRKQLVEASAGFTGGEIESVLVSGMYDAFADGSREMTVEDLVKSAAKLVPLMKTMAEKLEEVRRWGREGRAVYASEPDVGTETSEDGAKRFLDLDGIVGDIPSGGN